MRKHDLMHMGEKEIIWVCVEPMILETRGKSVQEKLRAYRRMTEGQRALYVFQVLFGHMADGAEGFFAQISYLTEYLDIWAVLKSGMLYFECGKMHGLICRLETAFQEWEKRRAGEDSLDEINGIYRDILPDTLSRIKSHILAQPEGYIDVED